jgi:hypothetical protein
MPSLKNRVMVNSAESRPVTNGPIETQLTAACTADRVRSALSESHSHINGQIKVEVARVQAYMGNAYQS